MDFAVCTELTSSILPKVKLDEFAFLALRCGRRLCGGGHVVSTFMTDEPPGMLN